MSISKASKLIALPQRFIEWYQSNIKPGAVESLRGLVSEAREAFGELRGLGLDLVPGARKNKGAPPRPAPDLDDFDFAGPDAAGETEEAYEARMAKLREDAATQSGNTIGKNLTARQQAAAQKRGGR